MAKEHIIFDTAMECIDGDEVCTSWFGDERRNLDKDLGRKIIAIADLGLWNGRTSGYKLLGTNLNEILDYFDCDDIKVYDNETDVCTTATHHDGTHYITFRLIKDGVDIDELTKKIYAGTYTQEYIEKHTDSLSPFVQKIYGW